MRVWIKACKQEQGALLAGEKGNPKPLYVYPAHFCLLPACQDKNLKPCLQALETKLGNYAIKTPLQDLTGYSHAKLQGYLSTYYRVTKSRS